MRRRVVNQRSKFAQVWLKRVLYSSVSGDGALSSMAAPSETPAIYRFEAFTLDLGKGCLHCGSEEVRLRPKPFEALRYVIERSGRLVSKDELTSAVWPDSFVSDNSLAQCFTEIRKALQDD